MLNSDNQKSKFVYIRSTRETVPVTQEQYDAYYKEADRIRHKEQSHGRCICPRRYACLCDGDCPICEFSVDGNYYYLDAPLPNSDDDKGDFISDHDKPIADYVADKMELEQLLDQFRELDPDADKIINLWREDPNLSDRAIARALGRPQRTFADQMKRYRTELHRKSG